MTPLNCILANSRIVYRRFSELTDPFEQDKQVKVKNEETLKIIKAIQQSGQSMWYYNQT